MDLSTIYNTKDMELIDETLQSTIHKLKRLSDGCEVALKTVKKGKEEGDLLWVQEDMRHGFRQVMSLQHPNIVKFLHYEEDDVSFFYVMEYFKMDLFRYTELSSFIPSDTVLHLLRSLLEGVSFLHRHNVIHRDLKLENIMLNGMEPVIIDFGFCVIQEENGPLLRTYPGSLEYAPPEFLNQVPYRGRLSDVWSLGVVLYLLLYDRYPFWCSSKNEVYSKKEIATKITSQLLTIPSVRSNRDPPELEKGWKQLLRSMLCKSPTNRGSVKGIIESLDRIKKTRNTFCSKV
jgi:serine/threonine protein kinase